MLRVAQKRWPLVRLTLINTTVQGEGAAVKLANAVNYADSLAIFDIIVVARGGGSVEDLWCFNEEVLADAIFAARTPVVSAVGHEVDYSISDLVADLRAPTPSACMELVLPDITEARLALDGYSQRLTELMAQKMHNMQKTIDNLLQLVKLGSPQAKLALAAEQITLLQTKIKTGFVNLVQTKKRDLSDCAQALQRESVYALQWRQASIDSLRGVLQAANAHLQNTQGLCMTVKDGKKTALEELRDGDTIELQSTKALATAKIIKLELL
jgi:exodeoxyribonuclease VII large subunit